MNRNEYIAISTSDNENFNIVVIDYGEKAQASTDTSVHTSKDQCGLLIQTIKNTNGMSVRLVATGADKYENVISFIGIPVDHLDEVIASLQYIKEKANE